MREREVIIVINVDLLNFALNAILYNIVNNFSVLNFATVINYVRYHSHIIGDACVDTKRQFQSERIRFQCEQREPHVRSLADG